MGARLGKRIRKTETSIDAIGPVYHVVYLTEDGTSPAGFVIVSGDDEAEPIVAFCSGDRFDPSPATPLGALVAADLPTRIDLARRATAAHRTGWAIARSTTKEKKKWNALLETTTVETGYSTISDVRVAPFVLSKWNQSEVSGLTCYNYYTPNAYPSGCVATALSQLLRYFQYPTTAVGSKSFSITVDNVTQSRFLRGGNGSGAAYDWTNMTLVPSSAITTAQRQAIGALLYDAGLSVNMIYTSGWSGADTLVTKNALVNTFFYSNAIKGYNNAGDLGSALVSMVNPNLDAGLPVLFGIDGAPGGHAIVCDGYGYNTTTLYHHLNMGWSGNSDAWYALPNIDSSIGTFSIVYKCVYNIYKAGSGEIISGRVTDSNSSPISGATVSTVRNGTTYTATTDAKGIYALVKIPSSATYTINASKSGYLFTSRSVTVGRSTDLSSQSGNVWGANFSAGAAAAENDYFASPCTMTGESWTSGGNNVGMTKETSEPYIAGNAGGHSAWWKWTAPATWTGICPVTVTTNGSDFDTLLACYNGTSFRTPGWVASNDDESGTIKTSKITFNATPGMTYRIGVDGKSKDGGVTAASGNIVLTLTGPATIATSVSPAEGGVAFGGGIYANGTSVTVSAIANTGYAFTNWTEDLNVVSNSSSYTFPASASRNLVANFQLTPWFAWRARQFSVAELNDPAISGILSNPEHDGLSNLLKYAFRLDRKQPNRAALPQIAVESGYLTLTYVANKAATDVTYTVEVSSDLRTWNSGAGYTSSPTLVTDAELTQKLKVTDLTPFSTAPARFMRLRVTGP